MNSCVDRFVKTYCSSHKVKTSSPEYSSLAQLLLQAFVWDLGFKDMPVDKIVDASVVEMRGRGQPSRDPQIEVMRATMEALSSRAPGSKLGPRYGNWYTLVSKLGACPFLTFVELRHAPEACERLSEI